jgi:transposase InsO family protein
MGGVNEEAGPMIAVIVGSTWAPPADPDAALRAWLREWAASHPRRGFRNAYADARGEGCNVNQKKVQRLWRDEGLRVPQRRSGVANVSARPPQDGTPTPAGLSSRSGARNPDFPLPCSPSSTCTTTAAAEVGWSPPDHW